VSSPSLASQESGDASDDQHRSDDHCRGDLLVQDEPAHDAGAFETSQTNEA